LKASRQVRTIVGQIKSESPVEWNRWPGIQVKEMCELYIEIGWCKVYPNKVSQYEAFQFALTQVELKIKEILGNFIKMDWLRKYMIMHSVFPIDANKSSDWLVKFMSEQLVPTDKEVDEIHQSEDVPDWVMEKLKKFAPRAFTNFESSYDGVRIEYKMWGDTRKGESRDPINVIDLGWEKYDNEIKKRKKAQESVKEYGEIDIQF